MNEKNCRYHKLATMMVVIDIIIPLFLYSWRVRTAAVVYSLPLADGATLERGRTVSCARGTAEHLGRSTRGAPVELASTTGRCIVQGRGPVF